MTNQQIRQVREYQKISAKFFDSQDDFDILKQYALEQLLDDNGKQHRLFHYKNGDIIPQNFVGCLSLKHSLLEIYPKIPLVNATKDISNKELDIFYQMLQYWRGVKFAQLNNSQLDNIKQLPMLEAFYRLFLQSVDQLIRRGLAKSYQYTEDNLVVFKGRLLVNQHIKYNCANHARFYMGFDTFTANRPANRLLKTALMRLNCQAPQNKQLRHKLLTLFEDIPISLNIDSDWQKLKQDRTISHYQQALDWVRVFLNNYGFVNYSGTTRNQSLLIPMEQVFEDFVSAQIKQYAPKDYQVELQKPQKKLFSNDNFTMKPDICLKQNGKVVVILDAKWKQFDKLPSSADLYQLLSYANIYRCNKMALLYPKSEQLRQPKSFVYADEQKTQLHCFSFDVTQPQQSVNALFANLPS